MNLSCINHIESTNPTNDIENMITAIDFNVDGEFIATADSFGRIEIFRVDPSKTEFSLTSIQHFTAHKAEFDYLRSELTEKKINSLQWIPQNNFNQFFISANSHEVKLWQMNTESQITWNPRSGENLNSFVLPTIKSIHYEYPITCNKVFYDTKNEYILDVLILPDQHSIISVDVGCVKLWDMKRNVDNVCLYHIDETQPELTAASLFPSSSSSCFLLGDENGSCRFYDKRKAVNNLSAEFELHVTNYFTNGGYDGVECISSIVSSRNGQTFFLRTFGQIQQWDHRNLDRPVNSVEVQWYSKMMSDLEEQGYLKDQFGLAVSGDEKVIAGKYGNNFISWDPKKPDCMGQHKAAMNKPKKDDIDFGHKICSISSHPNQGIFAVGSLTSLFIFQERK